MMFVTIFATSVGASALSYTVRTSMPDTSNKYYYSDLNPFYPAGYGLPNCTAYAFGRIYEITGKRPNLSTGNAENWYPYNQAYGYYDYGQTPRLGAIACWAYPGGGGHVAVVESIDSDGNMMLSNSAWSARYGSCEPFYLTYAHVSDSNPGGSSWWTFQGYIYAVDSPEVIVNPGGNQGGNQGGTNPVIIDGDDDGETTPGKTYSKGVYQVQVDDYLNMRTGAGTKYGFVTKVPNGAKIPVTAVKKSGSESWGETSYDGWDGWVSLAYCKYIGDLSTYVEETTAPATEPTEPTTVAPTTQAPTTQPPTTRPVDAVVPDEPVITKPVATEPVETTAPVVTVPTTAPEVPTTPVTTTAPQDFSKGIGVGDINADGRIDITDATCIQQVIAGLGNFDPRQVKWCDFDFDGKVTISDATRLQKYISGIYS